MAKRRGPSKSVPNSSVDKKRTIVAGLKRRTLVAGDIRVSDVKPREASSAIVSGRMGLGGWRKNDPDRTDAIETGDWDMGTGHDAVQYTDMNTTDVGPHTLTA